MTLMIPAFTGAGLLPPGDHGATLKEIEDKFVYNYGRKVIYDGLIFVTDQLNANSVNAIWINGSFVTAKERPRDVDVAYEVPSGADPYQWGLLSPNRRKDLKKYQRVDLLMYWPGQAEIKDVFCHDRNGTSKGIIRLLAEAA